MKSKIIFILIIIFCLFVFLKGYWFSTKYKSDNKVKEYSVFVESVKTISDTKVSYVVKLLGTSDKFILNFYDDTYDEIQTDLNAYSNYTYGDVIKLKGKISIPEKFNNPGEFDYKKYLYSNNIYGLINSYDVPIKVDYKLNFVENTYLKIYMFKDNVEKIIKKSMNERNAGIALSIIYGDLTDLDESVKQDVESIGVSHLMSVSGTHINYFMLVINILLGINVRSKKRVIKNKFKFIIQIFCVCFYIVFTGFSISVIRAGVMLIISIICDMLGKSKNKYQALIITFFIMLYNNPYVVFNSGMKLSFLATLGIILFSNYIRKTFVRFEKKNKSKFLQKIAKYIISNISITLSVQLLIIPVQIQLFNKLTFPIIIPNLILGILATPIIVIGIIGIMLSFSSISNAIFSCLEIFINCFVYFTKILKKLSLSISVVTLPSIVIVIYYLLIIILFVYFKVRNIQNIHCRLNIKKLLKWLKLTQIILAIGIIIFVIIINMYAVYFASYVYFFNVGQGDMSYIKSGTQSVIVDIGSMNNGIAYNTISNYFKITNLNRVDALIISHMHEDHVNGLEKFVQNYNVRTVLYAKPKEESKIFEEFKNILKQYDINSKEVRADQIINIGDITISILLPDEVYINDDAVNSNSLICKITIKDKSLLYMGDASKKAEEKLIRKNIDVGKIDVLKVGHHGSKTATSEQFIHKVKPQNAVISALKKYYNHPHESTIKTLKQNNVNVYMTEIKGAIKFNLN